MVDTRDGGWNQGASINCLKTLLTASVSQGPLERQYIILVKDKDSVARLPCLKSRLCHMLAVWPWTNHLTSMCLILYSLNGSYNITIL